MKALIQGCKFHGPKAIWTHHAKVVEGKVQHLFRCETCAIEFKEKKRELIMYHSYEDQPLPEYFHDVVSTMPHQKQEVEIIEPAPEASL